MKKLFIGLLVLGSFSSFAGELTLASGSVKKCDLVKKNFKVYLEISNKSEKVLLELDNSDLHLTKQYAFEATESLYAAGICPKIIYGE